VPANAEAACVLALAETYPVHVAVGRRWAFAMREGEDGDAGEDEGEDENEGEEADADAAGAEDDPRDREGAQRKAVNAADTGSTVGDDEAVGQRLEREWDGAEIRRGVNPQLLTMTCQSTGVVAWCRAALGPWLGSLYIHVHECC
jgi:hypothetical protein